ncbi:MAG: NADH-quinone oxidoreductase subunit N [candidate division NC10 bacterium]|nr:NADH-quinone oxidoreductase subunit N [candidate division NC10 bacterium]
MSPPFTINDLWAISPEMVLTTAAIILLILDFLLPPGRRAVVGYTGLLGIGATFAALGASAGVRAEAFSGMYLSDPFTLFFKTIFLLIAALIILISLNYLSVEGVDQGEYYALVLFATVGMMIMAASGDLLSLYIGLETMSLSIYVLAGFLRKDRRSNEAALKYLLMGAFSSGILLYGMTLLYGLSGSTNLKAISRTLAAQDLHNPALTLAMILLAAGFGFKIATVPFHMYLPDAYEGAPTSVTAFMSVGPKAAGFAVLLRVFLLAIPSLQGSWVQLFYVLSVLTMTVGNVVAIAQKNIKRMLAYSSIAHVGYLLIGLVAGSPLGISAILLYLLVYILMNVGAFAMVILLCRQGLRGDQIEDFSGLAQKSPLAAATMLIFLLSLAGIPPTGGFVAKFYVFGAAIKAGYVLLAVIAVVNTAISLFYYMRVAMVMYMREEPSPITALSPSRPLHWALAIAILGILIIGVYPGPFLGWAWVSLTGLL